MQSTVALELADIIHNKGYEFFSDIPLRKQI